MLNSLEPGDIIVTDDHFYKVSSTMHTLRGTLTSMHILGKEGVEQYIDAEGGYPINLAALVTGDFDHIKKSENVDIEELFDMERGRDELIEEYSKIQQLAPGAYIPYGSSLVFSRPNKPTLSLRLDKREEEFKKVKDLLEEAERKLDDAACNIDAGRKKYATKYAKIATEYATYLATEEHDKKFCKAIKEAYHESLPWEKQSFKISNPRIYSSSHPTVLHAQFQKNSLETFHQVLKSAATIQYLNALAKTLYADPIKKS